MGGGNEARTHLRLFVAAPLPPPAADAIETTIQPWRSVYPSARWVPPSNLHLTLAFLGSTDRRSVPRALEAIGRVAASAEPLEVGLRGLGAFPSAGRARVLWVGVADERGRLSVLAEAVRRALAPEFPPERRAFTAHVTVARADPPIELPPAFMGTTLHGPPFTIDAVRLMRSSPGGRSPRYESLGVAPLVGPPD